VKNVSRRVLGEIYGCRKQRGLREQHLKEGAQKAASASSRVITGWKTTWKSDPAMG